MNRLAAFACAALLASSQAVAAEDASRNVVVLLDAETGAVADVFVGPVTAPASQLVDTLLARLLDAERRIAERGTQDTQELQRKLGDAELSAYVERAAAATLRDRLQSSEDALAALRARVVGLEDQLSAKRSREDAAQTQIETLGTELNAALARVAFEQSQLAEEQRRRAELEAAERMRIEADARQLERYRSEFFGLMRDILADREGVRIVGDRFVFSSEVLFELGSADLAPEGRSQIANVVSILAEVATVIPNQIDWILRVDGHTDDLPLAPGGRWANSWELSQARALAVVLYMVEELGFPPHRLAANGFGEYRPVAVGDNAAARAQNRRIELKLTER